MQPTYIRLLLIAAISAGTTLVLAQPLNWEPLMPGLEVAVWDPAGACDDEVPASVMVRIDPERYRFTIFQYRDEGLSAPVTIQAWQQRTRATLLFNAGLFREDYSYLGLLLKDGRSLGSRRHPQWQGLFAAEPTARGLKKARVIDLAAEPFPEDRPVYREAAQSLMLLDRGGERVRRSGKRAHQMVVGEDGEGRILLVRPSAAVPLWELARCLRERVPHVVRAMAMDGGSSSDLLVSPGLLQQLGHAKEAARLTALVDGTGTDHIALPAVIGVLPR